mmetsp:Transcript_9611/g.13612  ORF Transcript_9611/g.13612 Transcript_9611/m.13612 type:complete len:234 (-) Transcript_9611:957-1658(-)
MPLTREEPSGVAPARVSGNKVHKSSIGSCVSGSLTTSSQLMTYAYLSLTLPLGKRRLNPFGLTPALASPSGPSKSKKSDLSIYIVFPNGTTRSPISSFLGWRGTLKSSIVDPCQFLIVTFNGSNTANARLQFSSITSLIQFSRSPTSMFESLLEIPTLSQNSRRAAGGTPLLLMPDNVGMRGSSHPFTCLPSTSWINFRLESTVYFMLSRLNSICWGRAVISFVGISLSKVQS